MGLMLLSILVIALLQQPYTPQAAPSDGLSYQYINPYISSLRSPEMDVFSAHTDDRSWKRALGPRPLRFG